MSGTFLLKGIKKSKNKSVWNKKGTTLQVKILIKVVQSVLV